MSILKFLKQTKVVVNGAKPHITNFERYAWVVKCVTTGGNTCGWWSQQLYFEIINIINGSHYLGAWCAVFPGCAKLHRVKELTCSVSALCTGFYPHFNILSNWAHAAVRLVCGDSITGTETMSKTDSKAAAEMTQAVSFSDVSHGVPSRLKSSRSYLHFLLRWKTRCSDFTACFKQCPKTWSPKISFRLFWG